VFSVKNKSKRFVVRRHAKNKLTLFDWVI
jgi:hypothetical protein